MSIPLDQFIREQIQRARTELSYQDAIDFLKRTVTAFEDHVDEIARFRETVMNLDFCDRQLVLIADGQLRLDLADAICLPVFRTPPERLLWARKHRKLTLEKLAAKSGIPRNRLNEISCQDRELSAPDAERLENALNLPANWLLSGAELPPLAHAA